MTQKEVAFKFEDQYGTHLGEHWTEGDYIYISYTCSAKKGKYVDVITEQSTRDLPEILARQLFRERVKEYVRNNILNRLGGIEIEFVGEPELKISDTLAHGSGLGKLLAGVSYDFHHWALVGYTVVCRVKKP